MILWLRKSFPLIFRRPGSRGQLDGLWGPERAGFHRRGPTGLDGEGRFVSTRLLRLPADDRLAIAGRQSECV